MDTMSWATLGAKATGVDFSDTAIDLASALNDEVGADAGFILSNVYDLPDEEFDIVFTSHDVLCWLPNLDKWESVVHRFLRPGSAFFILDGHPVMGIFEESGTGEVRPAYRYFNNELFFEGNGSMYTWEWSHSQSGVRVAAQSRRGRDRADRVRPHHRVLPRVPVLRLSSLPRYGKARRRLVAVPGAQRLLPPAVLNQGLK